MTCSIGKKCNRKIWIEDIYALFDSSEIFPIKTMSRNEKVNSITRLILVIFVGMVVLKYPYALNFLCLSVIIILILYFLTVKEYYSEMDHPTVYRNPLIAQNTESMKKMSKEPIITPRAHDRDVWSFPSHRHSAINYNGAGYDISEEYIPVSQSTNYKEIDPRMESYTSFNLDRLGDLYNPQPPTSATSPPFVPVQEPSVEYSADGMNVLPPKSVSVKEGFSRQRFRNENFNRKGKEGFTPIQNVMPSQELLIPRTTTTMYGAVSNKERVKYLENIGPNQYSYSDTTTPINANIGISYTPDIPPMVLDQVVTEDGVHPLYHRIDPQLIRAQGIPPERVNELPYRNSWSAKYSGFEAAPGSVNFEDVYDPRFTGYGDEYRSYGDVNLGQVQYYYSDVDAYRSPNFGIRTKVDHIDFTDPMGKVIPEYSRNVGVNDVKQSVHDQYNSDALYFREGLQERLMRKRNQELWQLRAMPHRNGANARTFTSNY